MPRDLTPSQIAARVAVLRDVDADIATETSWRRLHSLGHHWKVVQALVRAGHLEQVGDRKTYRVTEDGRQFMETHGS